MKRAAAATFALLLASAPAAALELDTSARGALWSSTRTLDDEVGVVPAQLWARASHSVASGENLSLSLFFEGWAECEATGDHGDGRAREGYLQASAGPLEFRLGSQIVAWGRTDGINPTDNLTPRQLTLLTRDPDDQRFGVPALRATWYTGAVSWTALWPFEFEATELPAAEAMPALADQDPRDEAAQWAGRVDYVLSEAEGSISYFDGYDVLPSAVTFGAPPRSGAIRHDRTRIVGADVATTAGRFGLRAEAAYSEPTAAPSGAVFAKQKQWFVVAGGDRTFGGYFNVNLQYYYRRVEGDPVPAGLTGAAAALGEAFAITAQQNKHEEHGLTFRLNNQWRNETVIAEISGALSVTGDAYLVRPMLKCRATDSWTFSVGGEILGGDDTHVFGLLSDNSAAYIEVRRGF